MSQAGAAATRRVRAVAAPARVAAVGHAALRALAVAGVALLAVLAGLGWLYVLRGPGALRLREALPLQRLARQDAQPLVRMALAWLPAGIVAGVLLRRFRRVTRAAALFGLGALALMTLGALSDSITASDPVAPYIGAQPGRAAIWVAAALLAAGAGLP